MNRLPYFLLTATGIVLTFLTIYYGFIYDELSVSRNDWKKREQSLGKLDSKLQEVAKKIESAQGSSKCDFNSECRIVGLGAKFCDLYKDFIIYSTKDADQYKLLKLVEEFNKGHEKISNMSLSVSKCGIKPALVHCENHVCVPQL